MNIIFKQLTHVLKWSDDDEEILIRDKTLLKSLDGYEYKDESLCDYILDGEPEYSTFENIDITGGFLKYIYDKKSNEVNVYTEYQTNKDLLEEEIKVLSDYTLSQWTDGVGSNVAQFYEGEDGIFPSISDMPKSIIIEIQS